MYWDKNITFIIDFWVLFLIKDTPIQGLGTLKIIPYRAERS